MCFLFLLLYNVSRSVSRTRYLQNRGGVQAVGLGEACRLQQRSSGKGGKVRGATKGGGGAGGEVRGYGRRAVWCGLRFGCGVAGSGGADGAGG